MPRPREGVGTGRRAISQRRRAGDLTSRSCTTPRDAIPVGPERGRSTACRTLAITGRSRGRGSGRWSGWRRACCGLGRRGAGRGACRPVQRGPASPEGRRARRVEAPARGVLLSGGCRGDHGAGNHGDPVGASPGVPDGDHCSVPGSSCRAGAPPVTGTGAEVSEIMAACVAFTDTDVDPRTTGDSCPAVTAETASRWRRRGATQPPDPTGRERHGDGLLGGLSSDLDHGYGRTWLPRGGRCFLAA